MCQKFPLVVQRRTRYNKNMEIVIPNESLRKSVNTLLEAFPIMSPSLFGTGSPKKPFQSYLVLLRFCDFFAKSNLTAFSNKGAKKKRNFEDFDQILLTVTLNI